MPEPQVEVVTIDTSTFPGSPVEVSSPFWESAVAEDIVQAPIEEGVLGECYGCNRVIRNDELNEVFDGHAYHTECLQDTTFLCRECANRFDEVQHHELPSGEGVCNACDAAYYRNCEACDDRVRRNRMRDVLGDGCNIRVCNCCFENNCFECNDCGHWVHEDRHNCSSSGSRDCSRREGEPMVTARSNRFETRMVGIEFETSYAKNELFQKINDSELMIGWTWHRDGSLGSNGMEIVTNPIGGGIIEDKVRAYYRICEESGSTIQGNEAGAHVHVNAKDIYESIYDNKDFFTTDLMDTAFRVWGKALLPVVGALVSKARRTNSYCAGGFAGRDCINWKMQGKTKLGISSYPTIAIRENTIEFRIWPSTSNVDNMLTRIELSQKAVDLMYRCVSKSSIREHRAALKAFNNTCAEFTDYLAMPNLSSDFKKAKDAPGFPGAVDEANRAFRAFCRMLGMSRQGSNHLSKLFNRFAFAGNPILICKTKSTIDGAE